MERADFKIIANGRGFQVQYKSHSIGGAGISSGAKSPRGKGVSKQIKAYLREGGIDIDSILSGKGRPDMLKAIEQIDNES